MCLAAPSRVIAVRDGIALTECFGQRREVSLLLLEDEVAVGDYLLIQAGGFAFERVDADRAEESLALMTELIEHPDAARQLGLGIGPPRSHPFAAPTGGARPLGAARRGHDDIADS